MTDNRVLVLSEDSGVFEHLSLILTRCKLSLYRQTTMEYRAAPYPADVIIFDLRACGCCQLKALQKLLTSEEQLSNTFLPPILALLSSKSLSDIESIYLGGAVDHLNYPMVNQEVIYRVEQALQGNKMSCAGKKQTPSACTNGTQTLNSLDDGDETIMLARKASNYLVNDLGTQIGLNELAHLMATNRNKLSEAFKLVFGTTVMNWLREQRMKKARDLLLSSHFSIQEIAYQVGYDNAANFSTSYRKIYSLSPNQERKRVRESKQRVMQTKVA